MARFVLLDAGPLWLSVLAPDKPQADDCRDWIVALSGVGVTVCIPEIADYEVRRELHLRGAAAGIKRLDNLKASLDYRPIRTSIMLKAAEFWALLRQTGGPTAGGQKLDADAILAATATTGWGASDVITIATTNVGHLARFPGIHAAEWHTIS